MSKISATILQLTSMAFPHTPIDSHAARYSTTDPEEYIRNLLQDLDLDKGLLIKVPKEGLQQNQLAAFQFIPRESIAIIQVNLVAEIPLASPTDVRKLSLQS